jgi:hypothetical protein
MTADDLVGLPDADQWRLLKLHRIDPRTAESELIRLKAEIARREADAKRSAEHAARRTLETIAPTLSTDDHMAIRAVMLERRCDVFEAASIVGQQRAADRGEQ